MKKTISLITVFILWLPVGLPAQDGGRTGFDFLSTQIGGRPSAMGGAFSSTMGDLYGLWYNPASIWSTRDYETTLTYLDHLLDIRSGYLAFTKSFGAAGQVATGLFYMNYGELQRRDVTGTDLGTFSPGDWVFSASYANHIWAGLYGGVSLKYFYSRIDEFSAGGIAGDLGLLYRIESQDLNIGLSLMNGGVAFSGYYEEKEKLPLAYRLGVSKKLAHLPLILNVGLLRYHHHKSGFFGGLYWMIGGEFTIIENFLLRWGYNSKGSELKTGADTDWMAGFSMGLGFRWRQFHLDYAVNAFGALGYLHHFTFTMPMVFRKNNSGE